MKEVRKLVKIQGVDKMIGLDYDYGDAVIGIYDYNGFSNMVGHLNEEQLVEFTNLCLEGLDIEGRIVEEKRWVIK